MNDQALAANLVIRLNNLSEKDRFKASLELRALNRLLLCHEVHVHRRTTDGVYFAYRTLA